jgi:DNA-binding NarL/FixJ family response regulator
MNHKAIRILLADDHRFFRNGVRVLLETVDGFEVVAETGNGEETTRAALEHKPDIILMDLQMPDMNGIETTRRIVRELPDIGIIIVTMFEDTDSVISAMRAGARGYILKDADEDELIRSIRAVASGEALFGPAIAKRLMNYITDVSPAASQRAFPELTDREREVLSQIAKNKTNQEIADVLGLTLKTVRNHVSSILAKLQVLDRHEAISRARAAGLGEDKPRAP